MALTATATVSTRRIVISSLCMKGCHLVVRSPNKHNIKYSVCKQTSIEDMLFPIVNDICLHGINSERVIIFCQTYLDTLQVFKDLVCMLGRRNALHAQSDSNTDKSHLRLCEKYDGSTSSKNQEHVVKSFTQLDGVVRVVVCTVAFGMGLDSPNVHTVIHWGAPRQVDMYVQETGRGGRDGHLTNARLYFTPRSSCSSIMKEYYTNSSRCRREILMSVFVDNPSCITKPSPLHVCCDVCARVCPCSECKMKPSSSDVLLHSSVCTEAVDCTPLVTLSDDVCALLHERLHEYRHSLCPPDNSTASLMLGEELLSGLSNNLLQDIVENCMHIKCVDTLINMGVGSHDIASDILSLINSVLSDHH